jgi:hypothetical protein
MAIFEMALATKFALLLLMRNLGFMGDTCFSTFVGLV